MTIAQPRNWLGGCGGCWLLVCGMLAGTATALLAQPPLPSQAPTQPAGTARVRGRVLVAGDGSAVRGGDVVLSGDAVRQAETDDSGRFEIVGLPAGRFVLNVTKGGFATAQSTFTSIDPGRPFTLAEGQTLNRDVVLQRGGVIHGRIIDDAGEPAAGLEIRVERYQFSPAGRQLTGVSLGLSGAFSLVTNDLGEYRIFGLAPGQYIVSARTRQFQATLASGRGGARDRAEGFMPTYFPGTTQVAQAQQVRVVSGQETVADFSVLPARLARVSGRVSTSGLPVTRLSVFLGVETATASAQLDGGAVAADGTFSVGNVPAGNYTLRVREPGVTAAKGTEVATMPISVSLADVEGLQLTTRPGAIIKGSVQWDGTAPRPTGPVRISAASSQPSAGLLGRDSVITYLDPENGTVREDDTFALGGIVGNVLFSAQPGQAWLLRAVRVDGKDVTDIGVDAASLDGDRRVEIVMTDKVTNVSGTARDGRRQPATDYIVVILPQQPVAGMAATRYTRFLRSDEKGGFAVRALPPGDYVAAAVDTLENGRQWDPAFQKTARSGGHRFTLDEGATLTLALELLP